MEKLSTKPISNRGAFCNYSLAPRTEICKTFVKQRTKNVPETSSKTLLPRLNFKTGHFALRREENIVQILQGRFSYYKAFLSPLKENGAFI